MALKDDLPILVDYISKQTDYLAHNAQLFNIYEGDLLTYVLEDLAKQLSAQSFESIKHRVSPVNVLKRLVDKLSKIYSKSPTRWLTAENEIDPELMTWYKKVLDVDTNFAISNEFFNLFKNTLLELYVGKRGPSMRVIPSDRFLVYSTDPIDPTCPTHYIKLMGPMPTKYKKQSKGNNQNSEFLFYIYTDTEFLPINQKGEIIQPILDEANNPLGINPIGKAPFVYINRSRHNLLPPPDTDTLKMTKIFPILLSDMNFAVMYQSFSIVWGIDLDDENITMSPNAFWRFKSDPSNPNKPQIGTIKPQVDIQQVMGFIMSQLSFWLQSRNIRPGSVGQVSPENFSSGVAKIVDEMDTYEDRQKQIPYFVQAEQQFWDLIINYFHPYLIKEGLTDQTQSFSPGQQVESEFPEQRPTLSRQEMLTTIEKELALQLTTRKDSIQKLNPDLSEDQVTEFMQEIDEENGIEVPEEDLTTTHYHDSALGKTSAAIPVETGGHTHTLSNGDEVSVVEDAKSHTHALPDGTRTTEPIGE